MAYVQGMIKRELRRRSCHGSRDRAYEKLGLPPYPPTENSPTSRRFSRLTRTRPRFRPRKTENLIFNLMSRDQGNHTWTRLRNPHDEFLRRFSWSYRRILV